MEMNGDRENERAGLELERAKLELEREKMKMEMEWRRNNNVR